MLRHARRCTTDPRKLASADGVQQLFSWHPTLCGPSSFAFVPQQNNWEQLDTRVVHLHRTALESVRLCIVYRISSFDF